MKTDDRTAGGAPRRRYEAPQLRRIRLVPNEAVLASCKNNATAGPAGPIGKCATNPAVCSLSAS